SSNNWQGGGGGVRGGRSEGGGGQDSSSWGGRGVEGAARFDARSMDFVIDEIAFICQLCHRYLDFLSDKMGLEEDRLTLFFVELQVLEGAYVQLEDAYCLRTVEEAVRIAVPIEVQEGVRVSSMVEDASFLIHKSLERSVSTQSEQAIMAVCNRVTEVLNPSAQEPSFYGGLKDGLDHHMLQPDDNNNNNNNGSRGRGGCGEEGSAGNRQGMSTAEDFSTALARALDEAVEEDEDPSLCGGRGGRSVEEALVGINSVHVALSSVSAIQDALERYLEASNPLVELMLEEVTRVLRVYRELRDSHVLERLEAVFPPVSTALSKGMRATSYALEPEEYECLEADLPSVSAALSALRGGALGGACRSGLLQGPFEVLVRKLAEKVSSGVVGGALEKG
ncbi:unnamed protein product, partial [Discosporangium mesarthrocarpum]